MKEFIIGFTQVQDAFLDSINQILEGGDEDVLQSQQDEYTGLTFGLDIDINIQAGFDDDSVSSTSGMETLSITSLIVPETILEDAGITSGQNA